MSIIDELTEYFRKFPGVGPRQAGRFVYYLLRQDPSYLQNFANKIPQLKNEVRVCDNCYQYHLGRENTCNICANPNRDHSVILITAYDADLKVIEKSGNYNGTYFILGGTIPVMSNTPTRNIRINELIKKITDGGVNEIIIALSANPEGENTTEYVRKEIKDICEEKGVKVSILGRGLSTGTEIEYSDPETIKNALGNRF